MYIDPNTGGMLFQILAVFFALFSGIILFFSSKIKMFFARLGRSLRKDPCEQENNEQIEPNSDDDSFLD
ncbi:hypothetical protein ACFLUC_01990 [Chloroflexota bacterium]